MHCLFDPNPSAYFRYMIRATHFFARLYRYKNSKVLFCATKKVVDPDWFNPDTDPDPGIYLNPDPDTQQYLGRQIFSKIKKSTKKVKDKDISSLYFFIPFRYKNK
jgi:hypothetical protein